MPTYIYIFACIHTRTYTMYITSSTAEIKRRFTVLCAALSHELYYLLMRHIYQVLKTFNTNISFLFLNLFVDKIQILMDRGLIPTSENRETLSITPQETRESCYIHITYLVQPFVA